MTIQEIHESAVMIAKGFKSSAVKLVSILDHVDAKEVYRYYGSTCIYRYAIDQLGLTEAVALALIDVARTSRKVPELRREIDANRLSPFKAKKICAVLKVSTPEQNIEWINKAKSMSSQQLERAVLHVQKPHVRVLKLQMSPEAIETLRRCQEVSGQSLTMEEMIEKLAQFYLKHKDPVQKALRSKSEKKTQPPLVTRLVGKRTRPPARELHAVTLRDEAQCTHVGEDGNRCSDRRFIQIHHILPVSEGGSNDASNLTALCSGHHRLLHWKEKKA